jgi:HD-GYP domain-containing protein (c-di-GMP phosphodiesterase class II)
MHLAGHSRRVARHALRLARRMGLPKDEIVRLREAAAVHDVGKLGVPREILLKPGGLTMQEFAVIQRHCETGASIVSTLEDPKLTAIVRHHHERVDGNGYPLGLAGEDIPLGARIVAVADTFDALTSARPYRRPVNRHDAMRELQSCAGTQLDREAVRTFLRCYSGWRGMLLIRPPTSLPRRVRRHMAWASGDPRPAVFR